MPENNYQYKVEALMKLIPQWLKEFSQELIVAFTGYVGSEMGDYSPSKTYKEGKSDEAYPDNEKTWSSNPRLRVQSGRLLKSFTPKKPGSLSNVKITGYKVDINIGTNLVYANPHEYGMFIKSKGRMHKYFWAKYASSRNEFYKIMALSVIKKGGIRLKKRPYFIPALVNFQKNYIQQWLTLIFNRILKALT